MLYQYVFDKRASELSFFSSPLPKPRSSIEQEFVYDQAQKKILHPRKVKDLTVEESADVFLPYKNSYIYPDCRERNLFIQKSFADYF